METAHARQRLECGGGQIRPAGADCEAVFGKDYGLTRFSVPFIDKVLRNMALITLNLSGCDFPKLASFPLFRVLLWGVLIPRSLLRGAFNLGH